MSGLRRLLRLLGSFRLQMALAVALGAATVCGGVGLMGTAAYLIASAALHPSIAELQVAIVGVRFFGLSRGVFRYLERLVSHGVTLSLLGRLRLWFFEALEPLAPARTVELGSADLLTRAVTDVESLQELFIRAVAPPAVAVVVGSAVAWLIGGYDPGLAVAFAVLYLGVAVLVPTVVTLVAGPVRGELTEAREALAGTVADGLQGMSELVAYGRERDVSERVRQSSVAVGRARSRAATRDALGDAAVLFGSHASVWVVLVLAIPMVGEGRFTGVGLAVVCLVVMAAFEAVQPLPAAASSLHEQRAAADRVLSILDARPAVADPIAPYATRGDERPPASLELHSVGFAYPGGERRILNGVDLAVAPGATVAVVGPSGAGKSTLVHLLLRFWDPSTGDIRLGGRPLPEWSLERLRSVVGVLPQRTELFTGTIRDNLLGPEDVDDRACETAAERVGLLSAIRRFPDGWDTQVGELGRRLSGGEQRRLALARLLLRDPAIAVLDEPTAGLDVATAATVMESVLDLFDRRTTVVITHRLVSMGRFDDIVVLDRGRVVQRGPHDGLMASPGLYRRLYDAQRMELPE